MTESHNHRAYVLVTPAATLSKNPPTLRGKLNTICQVTGYRYLLNGHIIDFQVSMFDALLRRPLASENWQIHLTRPELVFPQY